MRRQRKQIDYSGNAYDNMMRAAIMRQGRNQLEEGGHRRAALPEDRSGCPAPIFPIPRHCPMLVWRLPQCFCDRKQLMASIV